MAKRKKTQKRKYARPSAVAPERLAELLTALETGALDGIGDNEMEALVERLAGDEAAALLVALRQIAAGKPQRKAVNKALYRLEQRGVVVPQWREKPKAVDLAPSARSVDDMPVMMNEPYINGSRMFIMPHQSGRLLRMLQVKLEHPIGLQQLRAGEIGRAEYRGLVKRLVQGAVIDGSAAAVLAGDALRQRKLWEIGQAVHDGRTGSDVDHQLVSELRWPDEPPTHPALAVDLDDVDPLTPAELSQATRLAVPFVSQSLWDRIKSGLADAESSPLILSETTEAERINEIQRKAVDAEVDAWHLPTLVELFLDAALFHALKGHRAEAKTLREAVTGVAEEGLDAAVRRWLADFVRYLFTQSSSEPEEPGPSALIVT